MIKKMIFIDNKIFQSRKENFERQEPEPPGAALFALKPESAPGPRTSGDAQKKRRLRNTALTPPKKSNGPDRLDSRILRLNPV